MNRAIILEVFRTHNTLSRAKLASKTGLNPSTVSHIISELINDNFIRETDLIQSSTGRPGRLLEINPDGGCALGIDLNVDYIEFLITDFAANVLWRQKQASTPETGLDMIMLQVTNLAEKASAFIKSHQSRLLGVGVGVPGLVDVADGLLKLAPNLKWVNVPVREVLSRFFDCPIYVENEANAAALGEYYFGATRNIQNFIYLSTGIGLGSGIIIDGKLYRGISGYAGEAGHMILDINGEQCGCGNRGCWETIVSPRAIERNVQRSLENGDRSSLQDIVNGDIKKIKFDHVLEAAKNGDKISMEAFRKVATYMGIGIANLVNLFDIDVIVLGGALNRAGSLILEEIEKVVKSRILDPEKNNVEIFQSAHGADACVMGAVALVLDDIIREPALM